jgi:hypothetical protein
MRYTPTTTSAQSLSFLQYGITYAQVRRVAVFANVRNNSATTQFTLYARSFLPGGEVRTRPIIVPVDATPSPYWVYLGNLPMGRLGNFFVAVQASAAAGTLDIDSFVVVNLDDGSACVVSIDQSANVGNSTSSTLIINHHTLTETIPQIETIQSGDTVRWSGRGDIAIYTDKSDIEAVLLATGGAANVNRWRQEASAAVIANDWTVSRLPGRLAPE